LVARPDNAYLAARLRELSDLLEQQEANPFRVRAWRRAAETVAAWPEPLASVVERAGREGLTALPGVGTAIAAALIELVRTGGRWSQLERMRGELDPEQVFRTLPGVGEKLSQRIHEALGADSLQELEVAAHDGRLAAVPGVGPRRAAMIRAALGERLGRPRPYAARPPPADAEPPVDVLLDVDAQYRREAEAGKLPRIAPRRFNPAGEAWLPILHAQRGPWHFTALFSNTARAHQLGRTRDWVVLYFHTDHQAEGQRTVVTETQGAAEGRRVVRGRESECAALSRSA
jgi:putative hydrolase